MSNKYIIVSDSCCDLNPDQIEDFGIEVIPLSFQIKGKEYHNYADEREMKTHDFYDLLRNKEVSVTSQAVPSDFISVFTKYVKEGYDILYISFSSALSGTHNSSLVARNAVLDEYPAAKIVCIDSLSASMGQGLLVYHACKLQQAGKSIEEVAEFVNQNILHLVHWFTVDDLGTLKRGGRLSATSAFLGTLLNVKPVLHVSDEGKLVPVEKVRGRKKSLISIIERCKKTIVNPSEQVIFISHGDCLEEAKFVGEKIKEEVGVKDVIYNYVGPVIGSHSGPGTIALFYLGVNRN